LFVSFHLLEEPESSYIPLLFLLSYKPESLAIHLYNFLCLISFVWVAFGVRGRKEEETLVGTVWYQGCLKGLSFCFLAAQLRRLGKDSASYKRPSLMYLPQTTNIHTTHPQASWFHINLLSSIFRGYDLTTGEGYGMRNTPSN